MIRRQPIPSGALVSDFLLNDSIIDVIHENSATPYMSHEPIAVSQEKLSPESRKTKSKNAILQAFIQIKKKSTVTK
ncbi:hypothetical protein [Burkholderia cepacia]|uniref:hypothetical protein n=1 Tax=Burkholderia cepacia TaxID=292 RepID=UPI0012D3D4AF|nr:hypothetical protein [Burkholderia cepacia]